MEWAKNIDWKEFLKKYDITINKGEKKVLVLEGSDASGKSTTIDLLLQVINHCFVIHTSAPPKGKVASYYEDILTNSMKLIKSLDQPIILDRFHLGEKVYGEIFRGYDFNEEPFDNDLAEMGAKLVYVTADEQVLAQRLESRGDWYVNVSDLSLIQTKYATATWHSKLKIHVFDTTNGTSEEDFARLLKFIYD